jgi:hypothetical protein
MNLEDFIRANRAELIGRCRGKVEQRSPPAPVQTGGDDGVAQLLDQVVEELRHGRQDTDDITRSATAQGRRQLLQGFSVGQVVHGYGDVCQSVTELAVELAAPITADEFRTLNRCLDDAIAGAVTEHAKGHMHTATGTNELKTLVTSALIAFEALRRGNVGVGGSTGRVLHHSLTALRTLADR